MRCAALHCTARAARRRTPPHAPHGTAPRALHGIALHRARRTALHAVPAHTPHPMIWRGGVISVKGPVNRDIVLIITLRSAGARGGAAHDYTAGSCAYYCGETGDAAALRWSCTYKTFKKTMKNINFYDVFDVFHDNVRSRSS